MENVKRFAKRMDVWSEYRAEIERNTLKNNNIHFEDRKLKKMIENINDIDEAIINFSTKQELELTQSQVKKYGIHDHYKLLNIGLEKVNAKVVNDIDNGIKAALDLEGNYFCLDSNLKLSPATLKRFDEPNAVITNINDRLHNLDLVLERFPQTAKNDLVELNTILEEVKVKIENQEITNRVTTKKINQTYDVKRIYVFVIWSILVISVVCLILGICIILF